MKPRRSLYARPEIIRGEQCTRGALSAPTTAREERVVADIAKLSVGREAYYTRELATDHEGMRPLARRCSRRTMLDWPRPLPTWTTIWERVAATMVSSTCPDRGAGGRVRPSDVPGGRPAAPYPPGGGQPHSGSGRRVDGLGRPRPVPPPLGRGRDLPAHLPAGARPDARGRVDSGGRARQPRAGRHPGRPAAAVLKRTDQIDAEVGRLARDGRDRAPRLVKWAVHATRKPKEHQAADTL
jgi:hypothetical protein